MNFPKLVKDMVEALRRIQCGNYDCRIQALEAREIALTNQARDQDDRIRALESTPYGSGQWTGTAIVSAAIVPKTTNPIVSVTIAGRAEVVGVAPLWYSNPPNDPEDAERAFVTSFQREVIGGNTYLKFQIDGEIVNATFWLKYQYVMV